MVFAFAVMPVCLGIMWLLPAAKAAVIKNVWENRPYILGVVFVAVVFGAFGCLLEMTNPQGAFGILKPVLLLFPAGYAAYRSRENPGDMGLRFGDPLQLVIFMLPFAGVALLPGHFDNIDVLLSMVSPVAIVAVFCDEIVFRGYLQPRLEGLFGKGKGLIVVSLTYSMAHLTLHGAGTDFTTGIIVSGVTFLLNFVFWGVTAGLIYRRTGNVYGIAVFHIFWDMALSASRAMI